MIDAVWAQESAPWNVEGKLLGERREIGSPDSKKSEDVSGIACSSETGFPRTCLVVDDESQGAQVVILTDGELIAGDFIGLIDDSHGGEPLELDAEAVAFADGAFYVMGSHGRPRHPNGLEEERNIARAKAGRHVFRIRFADGTIDPSTGELSGPPEIRDSTKLTDLLRADAAIAPFVDAALAQNGLTVEGVAARDGNLYVGLRGPVLGTDSIMVSAPLDALFGDQDAVVETIRLALEPDTRGNVRGVRDIVPFEEGFLVLVGPVNDPADDAIADGDYAIYSFVPGAAGTQAAVRKVHDLASFGSKVKPEALMPLDRTDGKLRLLLLFDGPDEGEPRPITIDLS